MNYEDYEDETHPPELGEDDEAEAKADMEFRSKFHDELPW